MSLDMLVDKGKEMRTISLNTHYLIVFKNPRDNQQIATLARQMYPGRSHFLLEAFKMPLNILLGIY